MVDYRIAVDAARNSFDLLLERIGLEDLQLRQLALRQLFLAGELADAILELDERLVELVVIRLELCARERSRETRMMSEGKRKKASVDGRGHSPRKRVTQTGFEARRAASRGARARTEPPSRRAASRVQPCDAFVREVLRGCDALLSPRPSRPISVCRVDVAMQISSTRGRVPFLAAAWMLATAPTGPCSSSSSLKSESSSRSDAGARGHRRGEACGALCGMPPIPLHLRAAVAKADVSSHLLFQRACPGFSISVGASFVPMGRGFQKSTRPVKTRREGRSVTPRSRSTRRFPVNG